MVSHPHPTSLFLHPIGFYPPFPVSVLLCEYACVHMLGVGGGEECVCVLACTGLPFPCCFMTALALTKLNNVNNIGITLLHTKTMLKQCL